MEYQIDTKQLFADMQAAYDCAGDGRLSVPMRDEFNDKGNALYDRLTIALKQKFDHDTQAFRDVSTQLDITNNDLKAVTKDIATAAQALASLDSLINFLDVLFTAIPAPF